MSGESVRQNWKAILLVALITAYIFGGALCLLLSSHFVVKTYEGVMLSTPGVVLVAVGMFLIFGGILTLLASDDS